MTLEEAMKETNGGNKQTQRTQHSHEQVLATRLAAAFLRPIAVLLSTLSSMKFIVSFKVLLLLTSVDESLGGEGLEMCCKTLNVVDAWAVHSIAMHMHLIVQKQSFV